MKFIIWDTIQQNWKKAEHVQYAVSGKEKCIRFERTLEIHSATQFSWEEAAYFELHLFSNYVLIPYPF